MKTTEASKQLVEAMRDFTAGYGVLLHAIEQYERDTNTSINDLSSFVKCYPFDKSFDDLLIADWCDNVIEELTQQDFTVLNYEYLNTGGNTMVGIHEVWLPEELKTVYVYTNEEGCTMSVVDYIRNDIQLNDYDEVAIDYVDIGRIAGYEKYFELYRRCISDYLKDDCKYFGITRRLPYYLLSDELQAKVDTDYLVWSEAESDGCIPTNGVDIVEDPDYPTPDESKTPAVMYDDEGLQQVKDFLEWHTDVASDYDTRESLYDKDYVLTLADKTVRIPFNADTWDAVDNLLKRAIEEW